LFAAFLEARPAWARQRRTAALLEIMGRSERSVDPEIERLLSLLASSDNSLVKSRANAAQATLGLAAAEPK
jgi:hypothetical protein